MRLRHLSLDYFGHFTGKAYDFGDGQGASDFHVIYGPNEAGKTTTMEAVLRLLYGFPRARPMISSTSARFCRCRAPSRRRARRIRWCA